MTWAPTGDRLAYFVRTEKSRTLIIQDVLDRQDRAAHDRAESTTRNHQISPRTEGRVAFAALQGGVSDIFVLDLRAVT